MPNLSSIEHYKLTKLWTDGPTLNEEKLRFKRHSLHINRYTRKKINRTNNDILQHIVQLL